MFFRITKVITQWEATNNEMVITYGRRRVTRLLIFVDTIAIISETEENKKKQLDNTSKTHRKIVQSITCNKTNTLNTTRIGKRERVNGKRLFGPNML